MTILFFCSLFFHFLIWTSSTMIWGYCTVTQLMTRSQWRLQRLLSSKSFLGILSLMQRVCLNLKILMNFVEIKVVPCYSTIVVPYYSDLTQCFAGTMWLLSVRPSLQVHLILMLMKYALLILLKYLSM